MAIKNYTTKVAAARSIEEIQHALVKNGATGILYEYEPGKHTVKSLRFILSINNNSVVFSLPVEWQKFQVVMKRQNIKRWNDEEYCYRVAWRCLRDWVLAQLAIYETQIVELPQIFLPFAMGNDGKTLYEKVVDGRFLLGSGS